MILLIENGLLTTPLDANFNVLLNIGLVDPVPSNLVSSDDTRLTDARIPLDGTVTNASVASGAGIVQSKLNLDGVIPPAWIGTASNQAAQGDLAEYTNNKGNPNGYASLDNTAKVPIAQIPSAVGTGTVTSVGLTMPGEFNVAGSPITTSGTLAVTWATQSDGSWFGNKSGGAAVPQFYTTALPTSLIPSLDASIVTSGTFAAARLPTAIGIGASHAPGAVPDPGPSGGGALATDYLARDMTYKAIPDFSVPYQPDVVDPVIAAATNPTGPKNVAFSTTTPNAVLFYSLTSAATGFAEVPSIGYISLDPAAEVWCYAAKAGFNNSNIVNYTNPNP